jgi:AraC-like DNA-binding protein
LTSLAGRKKLVIPVRLGQYVDEIRLATSCEALRQPDASLESIIAAQGWRSASWFHRRFKAKMGCAPMAWRKRQEGK